MDLNTTLEQAAFDGDVESLALLLQKGRGDPELGKALHLAIENEQTACVQKLLLAGAPLEHVYWEMTPLTHAVDISIDGTIQGGGRPGNEPTEVIKMLLKLGADRTAGLRLAREYRSEAIIRLLEQWPV
jgi:hypothetical protein